jgi:hypothetical protein
MLFSSGGQNPLRKIGETTTGHEPKHKSHHRQFAQHKSALAISQQYAGAFCIN